MSFGTDDIHATPATTTRPRKPHQTPERLQDCQPGDVVRLEFGGVLVRVFGQRGNWVHCRCVDEDGGNESEPVAVPGSWRVSKQEVAE